MDFYALQVSLLPIEGDLFYKAGKEKDIRLFEACLMKQNRHETTWVIRTLVYDENGLIAGLISRPLPADLYDENFNLHEERNYPPVIWMWDRIEQALLIERKPRIFASAEAAARAFAGLTNPCLSDSSLLVHIHPKLDEGVFWQVYNSMYTVQSVELELTVPNIFGETKKDVRDFLSTIAHDTNSTNFKPTFENKEGKLNIKETTWFKNLLDWVKDGGGIWAIKGKPSAKRRITKKTSSKSAKILNYPDGPTHIELENYSASEVRQIIEALRPHYTFRRPNEKDI